METKRKASVVSVLKLIPLLILIISLHPAAIEELYAADLSPSDELWGSSMNIQINIGVVLDMGSWTGKNVHSCITMAISDFYASSDHCKARLVLHTRDSRGDPGHAISSARHLLKSMKVQALIVGPETAPVTKFLGSLGNNAKVPIFSVSSTFSSPGGEYPFLVEITQDETSQFKGIASILSSYQWKTISVIYEDTEEGKDSIVYLIGSLQERNIRVAYRTSISPFSTDDQILDELHKLAIVQQTIFIVHLSPLFTSRVFLTAKRLGMLKEGYAWIVTDKAMNQFKSMDWKVVESMQGVVGLKAYIPSTKKSRHFRLRWRNEFFRNNPSEESRELDVLGIWAYDTIWALAVSIENLGSRHLTNHTKLGNFYSGTKLLEEISRTRFTGLSGQFQILDGRLHSEAFAIVNVIGKVGRRVGFWTPKDGIVTKIRHYSGKKRSQSPSTAEKAGLETVIWPGVTTIAPKGFLMLTSGKKLRIAVPINKRFKQFASLHGDYLTNKTAITGFSIDVFHAAINSLDYQVPFEFIPYVNENGSSLGSYSGLVYQVYLQEYDGIVGDLTITGNRTSYVDFTVAYTDIGIGTITKREINDIWLFSKPLSPDLWLTSAAFFVLTGLVVWFIEHSSSNKEFGGSVAHQIGTMLWFGFSTLFYAHRERLESNLSRLVVIVWLFVVLILTSTYTATLSSMLTLQKMRFASAGDSVGIQPSTWFRGDIVNNTNFKDDRLRMYNSPEEYADALSRGSKKGGVGAIIDEIPYLKIFLAKYGADYAMVASQPICSGGFGFAFQKNYATLVSDLSRVIIKLREEGKLATMEKTWFESESLFIPEPEPDHSAATPNILNLGNFGGLFLISSLCSVSVLLVRLNSILLKRLNYFNNIIMVIRDRGILAFMLKKIAPGGGQIQEN